MITFQELHTLHDRANYPNHEAGNPNRMLQKKLTEVEEHILKTYPIERVSLIAYESGALAVECKLSGGTPVECVRIVHPAKLRAGEFVSHSDVIGKTISGSWCAEGRPYVSYLPTTSNEWDSQEAGWLVATKDIEGIWIEEAFFADALAKYPRVPKYDCQILNYIHPFALDVLIRPDILPSQPEPPLHVVRRPRTNI